MWFKNIKVFHLSEKFLLDDKTIEEKLQIFAFRSCTASMPQSIGWASASDSDDSHFVYSVMGYKMICLKIEEKILPASVVRDHAQTRIKELEAMDERKLSKREMASIKDQTYFSLIQQAFCRSTKIFAYFDVQQNWLVVNCTNAKKLELFTTHFKKAFEGLELITAEIKNIPKLMTQWLLTEKYPDSFFIECNAVLEDINNVKRVIRLKNQDLFNASIQNLIKDGCLPKQINLTWFDRITFNLNHDMTLTSLKYADIVIESADDGIVETDAERFDADFLIMTQVLQSLLQELLPQVLESKVAVAA